MINKNDIIQLLLEKAYFPVDTFYPDNGGTYEAQLVNGKWYIPLWGCNTLKYLINEVNYLDNKQET